MEKLAPRRFTGIDSMHALIPDCSANGNRKRLTGVQPAMQNGISVRAMPDDPNVSLDSRVRAEVQRGADTADFFSTLPTQDLQAILRRSKTLPIEELVNTGAVRIDVANQRIFRDVYWKGSFAEDSVLGFEERARTKTLHP